MKFCGVYSITDKLIWKNQMDRESFSSIFTYYTTSICIRKMYVIQWWKVTSYLSCKKGYTASTKIARKNRCRWSRTLGPQLEQCESGFQMGLTNKEEEDMTVSGCVVWLSGSYCGRGDQLYAALVQRTLSVQPTPSRIEPHATRKCGPSRVC